MKRSRKLHTRRKRRSAKAVMKNGKRAKRRHARKGGRTGSVFSKELKSRRGKGEVSGLLHKPSGDD